MAVKNVSCLGLLKLVPVSSFYRTLVFKHMLNEEKKGGGGGIKHRHK